MTQCAATCSYNRHWCWPGKCADGLASSCQCAQGFRKLASTSSYTFCDLTEPPSIHYCKMFGVSSGGEREGTISGSVTECQLERDRYVNFLPQTMEVDVEIGFDLKIDQSDRPLYINASSVGLTGGTLRVTRRNVHGISEEVTSSLLGQTNRTCDRHFNRTDPTPDISKCVLHLNTSGVSLNDGDRLCAVIEPKSGGYLIYKDFSGALSSKQFYSEVKTSRTLCLRYDSTPPVHCSASGQCGSKSVEVDRHITSSSNVSITVQGWADPEPVGSLPDMASGVEHTFVTLHEVIHGSADLLKVNHESLLEKEVKGSQLFIELPRQPALYAMQVEVKDIAHNVRRARTLVLYDSSSQLLLRQDAPMKATSATSMTSADGSPWQTNRGPLCVAWRRRFLNTFHAKTNMLLPLEPDPNALISGVYEHQGPALPVQGTPNVDGVTSFLYNVSINGKVVAKNVDSNLQQDACVTTVLQDGDTAVFSVTATDVMDHVLSDHVTVHVDSSAPELEFQALAPGLDARMYVHNSTDLSRLAVPLRVLDPHSGLRLLNWTLTTADTSTPIGSGIVPAHRLPHRVPCPAAAPCYCPAVGQCEFYNLTVTTDKLMHTGDHHRNYELTLTAENNAGLVTVQRLSILVDASPPRPGVVREGLPDTPDLDFSSASVLHAHWEGFLDHESGVFKFRVGLAPHCLTQDDLTETDVTQGGEGTHVIVQETSSNSASFALADPGKYYVTVVAYNRALMASQAVCSDGVIYDVTPPKFHNMTLPGAGATQTVVCLESPFLLQRNITLTPLDPEACQEACNVTRDPRWLEALPQSMSKNSDVTFSKEICMASEVPARRDVTLFLPSDSAYVTWSVVEEESEVDAVFVGLGSSETYPDILHFQPAHSLSHHSLHHVGLPDGTRLFILMRVENKAGLSESLVIGPVVIDMTPPRPSTPPPVLLTPSLAVLPLYPGLFQDSQEDLRDLQLAFVLGCELGPLTSRQEVSEAETSCPGPAPEGAVCVTASLPAVRTLAGEAARDFFFQVEVRDLAGQVATLHSQTFHVPSLLPPGGGWVFDLDPDDLDLLNHHFSSSNVHIVYPESRSAASSVNDVDFQRHPGLACVAWGGFRHDDATEFYLGLGTASKQDDVVGFTATNYSQSTACLAVPGLVPGKRYVASVKAVSQSRVIVTSSDGVTIITQDVMPSIDVRDGVGCHESKPLPLVAVIQNGSSVSARLQGIHYGETYTIITRKGRVLEMEASHVHWLSEAENSTHTLKTFVSLSSDIQLKYVALETPQMDIVVSRCIPDTEFVFADQTSAHWDFVGTPVIRPTHFSVALMENVCSLSDNATSCLDVVDGFRDVGNNFRHEFLNVRMREAVRYHVGAKACFGHVCGDATVSNGVVYEPRVPVWPEVTVSVTAGTDNSTCSTLAAQWPPVHCAQSPAIFYHVTATGRCRLGSVEHHLYSGTVVTLSNKDLQKSVSVCADSWPCSEGTVAVCVTAVCRSGQQATACSSLPVLPQDPLLRHSPYIVDVNTDTRDPERLLLSLSGQTGDVRGSLFQEADSDFLRPETRLGAALDREWEGFIEWSLMKENKMPSGNCREDQNCVFSTLTSSNYVLAPVLDLVDGERYTWCATHKPEGQRGEGHSLNDVTVCSDGFLVDGLPPTAGDVIVLNAPVGVLVGPSALSLAWTNFIDLDTRGLQDGASGIAYYAYALGTYEGGEDVVKYTNAEHESRAVVGNLSLTHGLLLYVTVRATDHVGLAVTSSSRALTVDTTPPESGLLSLDGSATFLTDRRPLLRWSGFQDKESGLRHFLLTVHSEGRADDVMPTTMVNSTSMLLNLDHAVDGHSYEVQLTAVNRAGLMARTTEKFKMDTSPPVVGGIAETRTAPQLQNSTDSLEVRWFGFADPHSGLALYRVGLGTKANVTDLQPLVDVGLRTNMVWRGPFQSGQRLVATVEACNRAGLCARGSSPSLVVDSSPPLPGLVTVGPDPSHQHYLHDRKSLSASWAGFTDPHSGITHYQWCLASLPSGCDVIPWQDNFLSTSLTATGLDLPVNSDLYLRVLGRNGAGLEAVAVSDRFRVDSTPPLVHAPVTILDPFKTEATPVSAHWDPSLLLLTWDIRDLESNVTSCFLSVVTSGHAHISLRDVSVDVNGFHLLPLSREARLLPGDSVVVNVTACNGAGLCVTTSSPRLLVDPSPPHTGGLSSSLTWEPGNDGTSSTVHLTWFGFEDLESGVSQYFVQVGSGYSEADLSGGTVQVPASHLANQSHTLTLSRPLTPGEKVVLSIWAENAVGLSSDSAKVTVEVLSGDLTGTRGLLEIQRHSCTAHYCTGDCTCAVVGGQCSPPDHAPSCREVAPLSPLEVELRGPQESATMSASSSCLHVAWEGQGHDVARFEWSLSLAPPPGHDGVPGDGVFDLQREKVWHDVGLRKTATHCLHGDRSLQDGGHYVAYVRAWYGADSYHVFTSPPLTVDRSPPSRRRALFVDVSVVNSTSVPSHVYEHVILNVTWRGVFHDLQSGIHRYDVMIGTSPEAYDVLMSRSHGLEETCVLEADLHEGTPHHVTVVAWNKAGLRMAATSRPLVVDEAMPSAGVVYNTRHHSNAHAQSSLTVLEASWQGFVDRHSHIAQYEVAVEDTTAPSTGDSSFTSVGLANSVALDNLTLTHGHAYRVKVRARDAAGHMSEEAISREILLDATPPHPVTCRQFSPLSTHLLGDAGSPEAMTAGVEADEVKVTLQDGVMYKVSHSGSGRLEDQGDLLTLHLSGTNTAADFQTGFQLSPHITTELRLLPSSPLPTPLVVNISACDVKGVVKSAKDSDAVIVHMTSPFDAHVSVHVTDEESGIRKLLLGAGTTKGGYQIQALTPLWGRVWRLPEVVGHGTAVYVTLYAENHAGLSASFHAAPVLVDRSPPVLSLSHVKVVPASGDAHSGVRVMASWSADDAESDVIKCKYSVGHTPGSADVQPLLDLDSTSGSDLLTPDLPARHAEPLTLTLTCHNVVGLVAEVTSPPVDVLLRSPDSTGARVLLSADSCLVQGETPRMRVRWEDFRGHEVNGFLCRVSRDGEVLRDWTDLGIRTELGVDLGQVLGSSSVNVTAEVVSYSLPGLTSAPVSASILLDLSVPSLTGENMTAKLEGDSLHLSWTGVFHLTSSQNAAYTLSLGRHPGASDLLMPLAVKEDNYAFRLPSGFKDLGVYVALGARFESGASNAYSAYIRF